MAETSDMDTSKLRRMLLWFESQLPPHDLAEWYFQSQPHARTVVNEDTSVMHMPDDTEGGSLRGYARCVRCETRFDVPHVGNFGHALGDDVSIAKAIERAKEWVWRDAIKAGPCWGDVPKIQDETGFAVLDWALALHMNTDHGRGLGATGDPAQEPDEAVPPRYTVGGHE